jgi:hypothetical protein
MKFTCVYDKILHKNGPEWVAALPPLQPVTEIDQLSKMYYLSSIKDDGQCPK